MKNVTPTIYRGPRPTDLNDLVKVGIRRVIDLESGLYDLLRDDKIEHQFPCEFGIDLYHMPGLAVAPPEKWIVEKAHSLMCEPKPILVHCASGVDRTGYIVAAFRMRIQGWPFEQAYAEWIAEGRHFYYDWWKRSLKAYA